MIEHWFVWIDEFYYYVDLPDLPIPFLQWAKYEDRQYILSLGTQPSTKLRLKWQGQEPEGRKGEHWLKLGVPFPLFSPAGDAMPSAI
jgi:hypothetical protein